MVQILWKQLTHCKNQNNGFKKRGFMDVILFFEEVFLFPIKNAIEILNMDKR